ncbi:MAG: DUF5686 and carboxypeptidase regulatory-like domain-containing protein [Lentimicrobiaceae bacterium]|nr:DUF5686 and carboxypeptidase regulatory-like domain-containing protein [Lentimicrobiaceae bacterium]
MGKIIDAQTREPIPFANVYLKGTTIGTFTDFEGNFSIDTKKASDSIAASFLGYITVTKKIIKNKFQTINFELFPNKLTLATVEIHPGKNPAEVLWEKLLANRKNNDMDKLNYYEYEAYTKIQFDANNLSEKFRNRRIFKPFQFIFDNVDTSTINGKAYLPIFLSETVSDIYFRKEPKSQREYIKASKVSGIENESISQFLGDMIQNINIYDNYLTIFQKNFVNPAGSSGLVFYKYYLVDSSFVGNQWCYQVMFKPRRKQEFTFTGKIWIHDSTYAIKKVDMRMSDDINMNFINDLVINQEYNRFENKYWMITKDQMVVDFNIVEDAKSTMGFYGHKTTSYKNFVFDTPRENKIYTTPTNIVIADDALKKSNNFWHTARHDSLTRDEQTIYKMVDTLKTLPVFNTYVDIVKMVTLGYWIKGNFEWGPVGSLYSFNKIEGNRFKIGGRTSNKFSTKIMLDGHVAYGTKDEKFKYGGGFIYMFDKNPRRAMGASFKHDNEQLGQSLNAWGEDFLFTSIIRRNPSDKLSLVDHYHAYYEHEWMTGFSNTVLFTHRNLFSIGETKFYRYVNGKQDTINSITTTEIGLKTHLAYKERFVMGEFERISLGAQYPVLDIDYAYGIPHALQSNYEYHRLQLRITDWYNIGTFGWSKYSIEGGKIWGKVPYPLLKIHEGNETYWFDDMAFNLMNYNEFVSNTYASFYYTHHFVGFFLNKIPLMRKLKWREVGFIKGVMGTVDEKNKNYAAFPKGTYTLDKPYFEAGVGVENILKFIRIDAVWRLSYYDHPEINKFGVMVSMWFDF